MYQPVTLGLLPNACASEGCELAMAKETLTLDQSQTIGNCEAIALVTAEGGAFTVAAAVAKVGNAGNGTVALTGNGVGAGIQVGTYKIRALGALVWEFQRADGSIGQAEVADAVAYVDQLKFTVTHGATPFAAGDEFSFAVTEVAASDAGLVKAWNPAAADGSEVIYGIAPRGEVTGAGENKLIVAYTRNCRVWSKFINWNGATSDQIAAAVATLAKKNMIVA